MMVSDGEFDDDDMLNTEMPDRLATV